MRFRVTAFLSAILAFSTFSSAFASIKEGQVIVRFADGITAADAQRILDSRMFEIGSALVPSLNLYLVRLKGGLRVSEALPLVRAHSRVLYAQPDHLVTKRDRLPNDPELPGLWNLHNPQTRVDISAARAWELGTGGKDRAGNPLVVAVVDAGMDIRHKDLAPNLWVNRGEIAGNGKDDDGNGYVDDVNGWNAYDGNGNVPVDSHGTHVAGTVGARGDNGTGVVGVNWDVRIMPVAASSGQTSVIAAGYGYVLAQKKLWLESGGLKGANIVATNSSFGVDYADCQSDEFPVWNDLYDAMGKVGILSAAATANLDIDVDSRGDVPTGCTSDYIVAVTNTTRQDNRNSGAAYGLKSVDLGAPGTSILSTVPGNGTATKTGTSMATPHVAGAIAFLHSVASERLFGLVRGNPAEGALRIKSLLLGNVDPLPALKGMTVSGGRLNLHKAAAAAASYHEAAAAASR